MRNTVGYTATKQQRGILLSNSFAGISASTLVSTIEEAVAWLTVPYPNSFAITWDLPSFSETLFSLLPLSLQAKLRKETRVMVTETIKIFHLDRWLGITYTKPLGGNLYKKLEVNIFDISRFVPKNTPVPSDATQIEQYGNDILAGYERMGIQPDVLTSPIGVFAKELKQHKLPTIYSNPQIEDACGYCQPMMRYEWRAAFKLGWFETAYSYDRRSAYPFHIASLPDTDQCTITKSDHYIKSDWAIVKGDITINTDVSPIVFSDGDSHTNPKGTWHGFFTKEEINWVIKRGIGSFKMADGYFIDWKTQHKPFRQAINKLFGMRNAKDVIVDNLAKNMAQGISGKLDQDNEDGSLGELYNPILAAMVRGRCRLAVANFIYDNGLINDAISVIVDSCLSTKPIPDTSILGTSLGDWRLDDVSPALVAGKGAVWKPDKKPLNVEYEALMTTIKEHPNKSFYRIGSSDVNLEVMESEADRIYDGYPKNGGELISRIYNSKAITIEKTPATRLT